MEFIGAYTYVYVGGILSFLCYYGASYTHVLHDNSLYASCTDGQVRCPDAGEIGQLTRERRVKHAKGSSSLEM